MEPLIVVRIHVGEPIFGFNYSLQPRRMLFTEPTDVHAPGDSHSSAALNQIAAAIAPGSE